MSRVRTMPRPKKVRSRSRASSSPSTTVAMTTLAVSRTVVKTESRSSGSVTTEV